MLASGTSAQRLFGEVLPWLLLLMGVAIVGVVVIAIARRMLRERDASSPAGFTLHDLRMMHAAGNLTDEEFARAKAAMIGRLTASGSENVPPDEAGAAIAPAPAPEAADPGPGDPSRPPERDPTPRDKPQPPL